MANVLAELGTRSLAIVRSLFRLGECHRRRSVQLPPRKNLPAPDTCKHFTKPAQSSGPENIGLQRPLPGHLAPGSVLSPSRITLENNEKIPPQPDQENAFARASGGASATGIELFSRSAPDSKICIIACIGFRSIEITRRSKKQRYCRLSVTP